MIARIGARLHLAGSLLIAVLFLGPGICRAGQTGQADQGAAAVAAGSTGPGQELSVMPDAGGIILKLAVSLIAVVGLILLLQRVARRWGGGFSRGAAKDGIQILSTRALGPRMSLALVQVMGRTFLIGISPQGIRPVADLGASEVGPGALEMEPPLIPIPKLEIAERKPSLPQVPAFDGELTRRLNALRDRYHTVGEAQAQFHGGRQ